MAEQEDKLLGDMTADIIRALRADRVAKAYSRITGNSGCQNCKHRQMKLNALHAKLKQKKQEREKRVAKSNGT